jgi:hypothetical protein
MSETTIDPETGEIHEGDEPADAQEEAEREAEQEAELEKPASTYGSVETWRQIDKQNDLYIAKIVKIVGQDAPLNGCEHCQGRGFTLGEQVAKDELQHPSEYVACERCAGYGVVESGSKHPDYAVVVCTDCSGKGYSIAATQPAPVSYLQPPTAPAAQVLQGQYVPGRGFIPYGSDEPLPGSQGV